MWKPSVFVVAVAVLAGALGVHSQSDPVCADFNHPGIDYADPNISVLSFTDNSTAKAGCCNACTSNPNCTIAMFRPHDHPILCILKSSAKRPVPGHTVVALARGPPSPPPPPPFRFANVYGTHMVLAAAPKQAMVWGFCNSDTETVTVTFGGQRLKAEVGYRTVGVVTWSVTLPATPAGFTPHTITAASSSGATVVIEDVLFGSVFVASGQSNMAYGLNGTNGHGVVHPPVNNSAAEIAAMKNYPNIRLYRAGEAKLDHAAFELTPATPPGDNPPVIGWSPACTPDLCRSDFSAMAWFFVRDTYDALKARGMERPIGIVGTYVGGTADELWSSLDALSECLDPSQPVPSGDSGLWNGMVVPLLNMTVEGFIWMQGEADAGHPGGQFDGYNCTLPAMFRDWRAQWHAGTRGLTDPNIPFGVAQLNSIGNGTVYNNPTDPTSGDPLSPSFGYAGLRWAETQTALSVPKTFLAVILDTPDRPTPQPINGKPNGDPGFNVHSPFKQPAGARLARAGLPLIFNLSVDVTTPMFSPPVTTTNGYTLKVAAGNVQVRSTVGFELMVGDGANAKWVSSPIVAHDSGSVTVGLVDGHPTKIRYLWYSNPCGEGQYGCAVYVTVTPLGTMSGEHDFLPVAPFFADL